MSHQKNNKSRAHWKKDPETNLPYTVPIAFYLGRRYLGCGWVPEFSRSHHRREAARKVGILYYNGIVFNKGKHLRDMRNWKIKCRNGKIRKDIDFIHPSDFPKSNIGILSGSDLPPMTRRQYRKALKMNRADFDKKYPDNNVQYREKCKSG